MNKKAYIIAIVLLAFMSSSLHAASATGNVATINLYGGNWGNSWAGSILFKLDTMPANVTWFYIEKDDISFSSFLSVLLASKQTNSELIIHYDAQNINSIGYSGTMAISAP
ncbi:hypothetical protein tloyanaT_21820 [Thalassotalea loyana]|uniref:Uncharacterized protein n=1 Tax=Thalassotalea loyana TaxID=280483 RepID=A0ABQ6HGQ6_9GAMM|nr:hypothetical protein [Thalassotalea loyana]GLX85930.1 hypothetical protein tloyanaT_21820 [Thalassotalea loyana]